MARFDVSFLPSGAYTVVVNIPDDEVPEDPYELEELVTTKAYNIVPYGCCAQCSGWGQEWSLDFGDAEVAAIYNDDGEAIYEQ